MSCGCPAHHVRGLFGRRTFTNPWPTWEERGMGDMLRWLRERAAKARRMCGCLNAHVQSAERAPLLRACASQGVPSEGWLTGNKAPTASDFKAAFPVAPTDWARLASPPARGVQVTWLGHATALVQMEGVTFLTDPVLAPRCSPLSFAGPKRVVPPALDLFDPRCPKPDFVVISHSHYDHLCARSVEQLRSHFSGGGGDGADVAAAKRGRPLHWYVPLGLAPWFADAGVATSSVTELDWWQEARHGGVRVACTPAQHWSQRTPWDAMTTLWSSWAVLGERRRFWFGGDTGYCSVFKEIGAKYGPFDLAAIPIGAYEPRWFHRPAHLDPHEAVQVHTDVRSRNSIAVHCCTWSLTDEALDEPPVELAKAAQQAGLPADAFTAMQHGETRALQAEEDSQEAQGEGAPAVEAAGAAASA